MAGKKSSVTATERMLNLVALLSETSAPLTMEDIVNRMRGQYPEKPEARRTTFERDKRTLRTLGIPITTQTLSGSDAGKTAYGIDRAGYALIDFGLTHDELTALEQAAAMVQIGTSWGKEAVQWLGGEVAGSEVPAAANVNVSSSVLPELWRAVAERAPVTFTYRSTPRLVHPYGLLARNGFWYLIGHDTGRSAQVTYRVDRITGEVVAGEKDGFVRPEDFDLATAYERDAKLFPGGDTEMAIVRLDHRVAPAVVRELGDDAVVARRSDGSVDVEVPCGNAVAFDSWLFAMVDRAEVLSPPGVRERIVASLTKMAGVAQ